MHLVLARVISRWPPGSKRYPKIQTGLRPEPTDSIKAAITWQCFNCVQGGILLWVRGSPRPPIMGAQSARPGPNSELNSRVRSGHPRRGAPMGYGMGAESNHKGRAVYLIRVNISILVVIIPDQAAIVADRGRYKLISVAEDDRRRAGEARNLRFRPRDGAISR